MSMSLNNNIALFKSNHHTTLKHHKYIFHSLTYNIKTSIIPVPKKNQSIHKHYTLIKSNFDKDKLIKGIIN